MTRLVLLLILLVGIAFGMSWIADQSGIITLTWQGSDYITPVPVALAALAAVTGLLMLLWAVISFLLRSPRLMAAISRRRRREKGWQAVSTGLLAIGAGDAATARKAREEAERYIPNEPLTDLLAAQTAQFVGDKEGAVRAFHAMTDKSNTRLLGLRGLHMEARRAGDLKTARLAAEEATRAAPALGWAAEAVIEARCADGDYAGARAVLERQMAQKGIDKQQHRRRRAVLLAAEAMALELGDPAVARERALEAVRLAPTLVPAAAVAGRLLGASGDMRKAARIIETAYAATPHPELAEAEAHLRPGDGALDRLKRIRILAAKAPGHAESAIAMAHAAIDAHDYDLARSSLDPFLETPTQRICLLMAELEASEFSDVGKAREWTARAVHAARDPAWIADGVVSDHWAPISPISGKLDAYVWAVPPGVSSTPILEHEADRVRAAIAVVRAREDDKKAAALAAAPDTDGAAGKIAAGPAVSSSAAPAARTLAPNDPPATATKPDRAMHASSDALAPASPSRSVSSGSVKDGTKDTATDAAKSVASEGVAPKADAKDADTKIADTKAPDTKPAGTLKADTVTGDAGAAAPAKPDRETFDRLAASHEPSATPSPTSTPLPGSRAAPRPSVSSSPPQASGRAFGPAGAADATGAPSGTARVVLKAKDAKRAADPILAVPPIPDDPGPEPQEPGPESKGPISRFLGI